ncbi:hypothetical protein ACHAW6_002509 [Cyclotella cf. meneghiniana]
MPPTAQPTAPQTVPPSNRLPTRGPPSNPNQNPATHVPTSNSTQKQPTTPAPASKQQVPCIAVIDHDYVPGYEYGSWYRPYNNTQLWLDFRKQYPDRPFCLLMPYRVDTLKVDIPLDALKDPNFQVKYVDRDDGSSSADDWFKECELGVLKSSDVKYIGLFVDAGSGMSKFEVKTSYNQFLNDTATANLAVCEVYNEYKDWISPFMTSLIPDVHSCANPKPI